MPRYVGISPLRSAELFADMKRRGTADMPAPIARSDKTFGRACHEASHCCAVVAAGSVLVGVNMGYGRGNAICYSRHEKEDSPPPPHSPLAIFRGAIDLAGAIGEGHFFGERVVSDDDFCRHGGSTDLQN